MWLRVSAMAEPRRLPPFAITVGRVLSVGADEQVIKAHAGWVVAPMTDVVIVLQSPATQNIGDSVGADLARVRAIGPEASVPVFVCSGGPFKALADRLDL